MKKLTIHSGIFDEVRCVNWGDEREKEEDNKEN